MQAMIFAAGMGTRLKPLTDVIPKALVPVAGKPLLQHVLDKCAAVGAERVVVNVHHHAEQIRNFLTLAAPHYSFDIKISDESEQLLETGGGLKHARRLFDDKQPVLIHNVDILGNADLRSLSGECGESMADACLLVSWRETQRYLLFSNDMRLEGWVNIASGQVKSPNEDIAMLTAGEVMQLYGRAGKPGRRGYMYAFAGMHAVTPGMLDAMDEWPDRFAIMDFYLHTCAERVVRGIVQPDLQLLDVGKLDTLAQAEEFVRCLG